MLLGFITNSMVLSAQSFTCGTVMPRNHIETLSEISRANPVDRLHRKVSIVAHIVRDSLWVPSHSESSIISAINNLNTLFEPIALSFEVCQFRYIDNYNFHDLVYEEEEPEMLANYNEPNVINMYFVNSISIYNMPAGGYAGNIIVIAILGAIPHEMGHYLGLVHTFQNGGGLVNSPDCTADGDGICDTEADPYYPLIPMDGCNIAEDLVDANGDYYVPPTDNIMSYYGCACKFTQGQYNAMAAYFLAVRNNLW